MIADVTLRPEKVQQVYIWRRAIYEDCERWWLFFVLCFQVQSCGFAGSAGLGLHNWEEIAGHCDRQYERTPRSLEIIDDLLANSAVLVGAYNRIILTLFFKPASGKLHEGVPQPTF